MIKAVIIDDVQLARISLKADLEDYCPNVQVLGEADGVMSGMKLIRKLNPELVFLDIHMADGEGFDILEILNDLKASVVFTTASDQHAIKAFQNNAVDYLLKPIDSDLLIKAVQKHSARLVSTGESKSMNKSGDTITLSTQDDLKIVLISDIVRCESDGNYTTVFEVDGSKTMISKPIKGFEKKLQGYGFYRSHQSHLVQMKHVKAYLKSEGGFLKMIDDSEVPVSVRKKSEVMRLLK